MKIARLFAWRRLGIGIAGLIALASMAVAPPQADQIVTVDSQLPATSTEALVTRVAGTRGVLELTARDQNGRNVAVSGQIVAGTAVGEDGQVHQTDTLVIESGPENASVLTNSSAFNDGLCRKDGSLSVQACITIFYDIRNSSDYYFARVSSYTAKWTKLDPVVTLYNGNVNPHAYGRTCSGGTLARTSASWNKSYPASGANYSYTPPWSSTFVQIYSGVAQYQNVNSTLTWKRGTGTYYISANYTLPDDGGWPIVGGCQ